MKTITVNLRTSSTAPVGGSRVKTNPPTMEQEFDYPFKKAIKWFKPRIGLLIFYVCAALFLWATWKIK